MMHKNKLYFGTVFDLKNFFLRFSFVIFISFLIYPVSVSSSLNDANLVANPSFENGSTIPLFWAFVTNSGNIPYWDTISHSGARSVRVQIRGTTNKISGYPKSDLISAQPLSNYTLSAWGKTKNTGGTNAPAVRVVELDANKKKIGQTSLVFSKGTNNWLQKTIDFKTGPYTRYLYVYANIGYGYGTFWVDDIKLNFESIPTPTPTPIPINQVGEGKIINPANADYIVNNKADLLSALSSAKSGNVIYIRDTAQIDLTGEKELIIPEGVALASGRGNGSSQGALIHTNTLDNTGGVETSYILFKTRGPGVRITGLRLQGNDNEIRNSAGEYTLAAGVYSSYNIEIDNSEIMNWSDCAICLYNGAVGNIHNNYIHHNIRTGYGYGVLFAYNASGIVEYNQFDYNRHSIAGDGRLGTSYIARYNIVFGNGTSHAFDMHGGADRSDGTNIAGRRIDIYGNTFYKIIGYGGDPSAYNYAIVIRGVPTEGTFIHDNYLHFDNPDSSLYYGTPILQTYCDGISTPSCNNYTQPKNFNVYNNTFNGVYVP